MFRFTIRDVLWLTVVVAVVTTLATEWRRARQRFINSVTWGPVPCGLQMHGQTAHQFQISTLPS
jgi:hypothetical protein